MHKCKYCDESFENKGLLMTHYRTSDCKNEKPKETKAEKQVDQPSIPIAICPPEIKCLSDGRVICLRVLGKKEGDQIIITHTEVL